MREILNHRQLAHPHIVAFKEVFVTPQVQSLTGGPRRECTWITAGHASQPVSSQAQVASAEPTPPCPLATQYLGIVMEYVGGGNLQQYVEAAGRLPEWQARCFFQQLILALRHCHRCLNIAHRDIKLGNVLLNTKYQARGQGMGRALHGRPAPGACLAPEGARPRRSRPALPHSPLVPSLGQIPILKVCDFGYSKNMVDSAPKTRVGTAAYISPEVCGCVGVFFGGGGGGGAGRAAATALVCATTCCSAYSVCRQGDVAAGARHVTPPLYARAGGPLAR